MIHSTDKTMAIQQNFLLNYFNRLLMLPFRISIKSGAPIYEQVTNAVKRAIAKGELKPGDALPSVRELSRELQINPNTAQKVVTALVNEKLIEVMPGIGSVVSARTPASQEKLALILGEKLETFIVEAITFGISEKEFFEAVRKHWKENS